MKKISITIIVAAYNEEENIEKTLIELHYQLSKYKKQISYEILVYDDNSTDKTWEIINKISKKYRDIIPIHNIKNLGLGGILKDGIKRARKERIMLLPGDGQFKAEEIPYLIKQSVNTDVLITYHKNYYIRPLKRRILSFLFHFVIKIIFCIPYKYTNWLHIYKKKVFEVIPIISDRFTFSAEIVIKAHKLGYKIKEVPSYLKEREKGKSSALKIRSIINAIYNILKITIEIYLKNRKKYILKNKLQ